MALGDSQLDALSLNLADGSRVSIDTSLIGTNPLILLTGDVTTDGSVYFDFVGDLGTDTVTLISSTTASLDVTGFASNLSGTFEYNYDADTSTGTLTFAAVPEPAIYAAILGSFALSFAAYRRRK